MTPPTIQTAYPALPDRLRQRAEALGMTLVRAEPEGRCAPLGDCPWIERLLLASPQFAAQARTLWPQLASGSSEPVELWPGLWLAPLPALRRRRGAEERFASHVLAALLLGEELLTSEQLHRVCDAAQTDFLATVARIDRSRLFTRAEGRRLSAMLAWMQQDNLEIDRRYTELQTMSQQLGESYEELSLLYKLSSAMTVDQPPGRFLTEACKELQQVLGLRWMALQLTDDEPRLNELVGQIYTAGPIGCDPAMLKRVGVQVMRHLPPGAAPLIVDDTRSMGIPNLDRLATQLLVVSLLRDERPFGILYGGDKLDGSQISSVDSKLCNSLANGLSIFLDNMILYEDMEAMFLGTLHALTASIDAKDSYTRGHSERVALMSRELARAAGVDARTADRVYIAGLVHDVGKIGVPEAVLCKPGRLSEEEFALIRMHPEIGARILEDIRQMQDLIPGVLYHHERWDGQGYPHGLAGADIPLFGRLICIADSFDAMSSNRTYRSALDPAHVLAEIARCGGTQFDPDLAAAFVRLDFRPFYELLEKHHHQEVSLARPGGPGSTAGVAA